MENKGKSPFSIAHLIRCGMLPHLGPVQLLRKRRRLPPRVPADKLHPSPADAAAAGAAACGAAAAASSAIFLALLPTEMISFFILFRGEVGKRFEGGADVAAVSCFFFARSVSRLLTRACGRP